MVFFQQCFEGSAHPISSHQRISFIEGSHSSKDLIHFISSKNQSHLIEGSISSHSSHRKISFIEGSHSFHLIEESISSHSSHRRISFIEASHSSKDLIHRRISFISSKDQSHLIHLIEGSAHQCFEGSAHILARFDRKHA
jgi:hypothetical protein